MNGKKLKKVIISIAAGAMICSNVPVKAMEISKPNALSAMAYVNETVGLAVEFSSEYAKVGTELKALASGGDNYTYQWFVGDKDIFNKTDSYTPTSDDLEKMITVKVTSGKEVIEKSIYCSKLPVIYIDTENQAPIVSKDDYVSGTMKMQGNETFNQNTTKLYEGKIEIKGRGNSTWHMPKKPYKIKLDKSTNLLDMGKSKHWVLLANYSDPSLMRNTLAYNLSGKMNMPQMETTWVDVILNGKYIGNYQFCEQVKIDKNRIDIFDWESFGEDTASAISEAENIADDKGLEDALVENLDWVTSKKVTYEGKTYQVDDYIEIPDITGGYLMELDEYYDEISKFRTKDNQPIMFKSPEFLNTNKTMMNYVQEYIQAFENAIKAQDYMANYQGEAKHYSELFDFDSLVDYWLINEIFYNEELNKKSTYMYKDIDGLVKMGPIWDMDYSSGGEGQTYVTNGWATKNFNINAQSKNWYKSLIKDPYFVLKAQERYWEIRDTFVEDMVKTNGEIDTSYDLLKESGKANSNMWFYKADLQQGSQALKKWLNTHLAWLDEQFNSEDSVINSLDSYKTTAIKLSLTDMFGNALLADTVSKKANADVIGEDGRDLNLNIQALNASKAQIYVNGILVDTVNVVNNEAKYRILASQLTAQAGYKDIIEVKTLDSNNNLNGSNYVSILESEKEDRVVGIEVTNPVKIEYFEGEEFDPTGLKVYTVSENGVKKDVTANITVTGFTGEIGENKITVTYGDFSKEFIINVKAVVLDKIELISLPSKIEYFKGEDLVLNGLIVKGVYNNGTSTLINDYQITGYDKNKVGQQTISVNYNGHTVSFNVFVKDITDENTDKLLLQAAIDYADSVSQETLDKVIPIVANEFKAALTEARAILANSNATQEEIDASFARLSTAIQMLSFEKGDKTILQELVVQVDALIPEEFTRVSWDDVQAALDNAKAVLGDENAMQEEINEVYTALKEAVDNLELAVDKTLLESFYNNVKDLDSTKYITSTWNGFVEALNNAKGVLDNEEAKQLAVDNAYTNLVKAYMSLRLVPNKDLLNDMLNKAVSLNEPALANVIARGKAVYNDPEATQIEVNQVVSKLNYAINKLTNQGATTATGSVKTGDAVNMFVPMAGLLAAGYVLTRKKED